METEKRKITKHKVNDHNKGNKKLTKTRKRREKITREIFCEYSPGYTMRN